jgi:hypothetical protein
MKIKDYRQTRIIIALLALFVLGTIDLVGTPPLWGDEGWTLCVARNWVVLGHYGCLLAGQPAPPTLSAHFPVVASIGFSFYLFGVGIWQARIVGLLFTAGALMGLYYLTHKLFNRSVALAALIMLLLLPARWEIHPLIIGRQVLGEMPSLFYLLAGYICFLSIRRNPLLFTSLALGFWALALMTKAQLNPFWVVSLVMPLVIMALKRQWQMVGLLVIGLLGSLGMYQLLLWGQQLLLSGHRLSAPPLSGLYEVTAVVPVAAVRLTALRVTLLSYLPVVLGLSYAVWNWGFKQRFGGPNNLVETGRLMLLGLAGSWLAWFTFLSAGYIRYIFPAIFIAAPFTAAMLYDLTDGFNLVKVFKAALSGLETRRFHRPGLRAAAIIFLIIWMGLWTGRAFDYFINSEHDSSILSATHFLNTSTPPDALVETNASELFFLLERPYHYPPAQIYVDLDYRSLYHSNAPVIYEPLAADPDYLVVNPLGQWLHLYDPVIETGNFRLLKTIGRYQIYERVY